MRLRGGRAVMCVDERRALHRGVVAVGALAEGAAAKAVLVAFAVAFDAAGLPTVTPSTDMDRALVRIHHGLDFGLECIGVPF